MILTDVEIKKAGFNNFFRDFWLRRIFLQWSALKWLQIN